MYIFGELTFIETAGKNKHDKPLWRLKCSCGNETIAIASTVRTGRTKSCGHLKSAGNRRTHGRTKTFLYSVWGNMKSRCDSQSNPAYCNYGARGITYQPSWKDFAAFAEEVGEPPTKTATLDRIDNDGNYEVDNVRWAERDVQARNTRQNVWVAIGDETKCLYDWCDVYGINAASVYRRLAKGEDIVSAITRPKAKRFQTRKIT